MGNDRRVCDECGDKFRAYAGEIKRVTLYPYLDSEVVIGQDWWAEQDYRCRLSVGLCCDETMGFFEGLDKNKPITVVLSRVVTTDSLRVKKCCTGYIFIDEGTIGRYLAMNTLDATADWIGEEWVYASIEVEA
jgi:hypothetical protein